MGYIYTCDGCDERKESFPPFAGEFTEQFLKTTGGKFARGFKPGQKVTLCADCMELMVLAGKMAVCYRCGFATRATDLPAGIEECPQCEEDALQLQASEGEDDG